MRARPTEYTGQKGAAFQLSGTLSLRLPWNSQKTVLWTRGSPCHWQRQKLLEVTSKIPRNLLRCPKLHHAPRNHSPNQPRLRRLESNRPQDTITPSITAIVQP